MKKVLLSLLITASFGTICQAQNEKNIVYDANASKRNVSGFEEVEVSGAIDLYLSQGTEDAVAVSGSSAEVVSKIKTEVKSGVLHIYLESGWGGWKSWGNTKMKAYVTFKTLKRIEASGACNVKATQPIKVNYLKVEMSGASDFVGEVTVEKLNLDASGASNIKISGKAGNTKIEASGASNVKGYNLKTDIADADASGAANIQISVSKELSADASGGSNVYYKGSAVVKESHTSGGANIKKRTDGE